MRSDRARTLVATPERGSVGPHGMHTKEEVVAVISYSRRLHAGFLPTPPLHMGDRLLSIRRRAKYTRSWETRHHQVTMRFVSYFLSGRLWTVVLVVYGRPRLAPRRRTCLRYLGATSTPPCPVGRSQPGRCHLPLVLNRCLQGSRAVYNPRPPPSPQTPSPFRLSLV